MAIFAANRSFQISLEIQSRTFLISALARNRYSSSGPVRYIPNKDPQIRKSQKDATLASYEKKEETLLKIADFERRMGPHKFSNFVGMECQNSNSSDIFEQVEEFPELLEDANSSIELMDTDVGNMSELKFDEISDSHEDIIAETDELLSSCVRQDAENLAIELLAARAFTELELRRKLRGKKYPNNIVESVITDIKSRGLLNDGLYAESFSRSRWLSSTWGPRRIKQALVQKGVKEKEVEKAMNRVFIGDEVDGGQTMQHGMSKLSMDHLFVQASKQWLRSRSASPENRKARIVRWLQYRGFDWGVTNVILKKLEAEYPP